MSRRKTDRDTRKPRVKQKLQALSERDEAAIVQWFLDAPTLPYKEAAQRIHSRFGIKLTTTAVCNFWHASVSPILEARHAGQSLQGKHIDVKVTIRDGLKVVFQGVARVPIPGTGKDGR